jgi:autophagy-related protein 16-1
VRAAYTASLESQISFLRDELATVYKTQGQNAQRLLAMNETLREKEEAARIDVENLRKTREEVAALRRKVEQHAELMAEKDRTAQVAFSDSASHLPEPSHTRVSTDPPRRDQHLAARAQPD